MKPVESEPVTVLVVHGPNLNMLGKREPTIYGSETLADVNAALSQFADSKGVMLETFQSNSESAIIERIHDTHESEVKFIIINPAAYTHTSVALRDALLAVGKPFIEVHISNVYQRETFRKHSYFSDKAEAVISGCGTKSYLYALQHAIGLLEDN